MINAVCFDLFHTLVDVGQVPDSVGRYTADVLGLDHDTWNAGCFSSFHEIRKPTRHIDVIHKIAHGINPDIPYARIEQAVEDRQRRFDYALVNIEQVVLDVINRLRDKQIRVALVSNASTAEVSAWPSSPMAQLFDATIFSCECGYAKPEREIYRHAADSVGVKPEKCLFVGDGGSDEHLGARQAGMVPVLLTRFIQAKMNREKLEQRRQKADHEIHQLDELLGLIESLR